MISVCIATHNGDKYIKEQVDSILCQLSHSDEVIVSDDGSTDNTLAILMSYNDPRIKIHMFTHHRKYNYRMDYSTHNFENALTKAKGDVIFLADQDDVWMPNKVDRVMSNISDCDILFHGRIVVDSSLFTLQDFAMPRPGFFTNFVSCTTTGCCCAFKRRILNEILPFPESGVGHDFWIGVYGGLFFKCKFLQEPLILFRRHDNNVTPSNLKSSNPISMRLKYRFITLIEVAKRLLKSLIFNKTFRNRVAIL